MSGAPRVKPYRQRQTDSIVGEHTCERMKILRNGLRCWPPSARHSKADRMAAHRKFRSPPRCELVIATRIMPNYPAFRKRKSDRRRDDLCAGGLRKRAPDIFRNASARRRSRYITRALNRGDSAVCESHFKATLPTARPRVIPFHDCFCSGGGLLTTYRRAYQGGDLLSCHSYL